VLWIERRPFEFRDGAGQVDLHQGNTQPIVRLGEFGPTSTALEASMLIVVPIPICQAEIYMKLGIARIALDVGVNLAD
jgi:hypothetical protein